MVLLLMQNVGANSLQSGLADREGRGFRLQAGRLARRSEAIGRGRRQHLQAARHEPVGPAGALGDERVAAMAEAGLVELRADDDAVVASVEFTTRVMP